MTDDAAKLHAVIKFKRDISLPRFSMKAGERWGFVVFGKMERLLAAIKAGDRFEFAGGQCLAEDVEVVYEGPANIEYSVAAGYVQRPTRHQHGVPDLDGSKASAEAKYIHPDAVRTSIRVIVAVQKCEGDWLKWSRPAALSTDDPKRNLQGGWKTPLCREVEAAMCDEANMASAKKAQL